MRLRWMAINKRQEEGYVGMLRRTARLALHEDEATLLKS